ncbi:MAG TPA: hypothetical protein DCM58_05970 [Desulfovibrio sp.]|nr:hypothetical protein [Desulfovibrio sp.]
MLWIILGVIAFFALLVFLLALCRAAGTDNREFEDEEQLRAIREWQEERERKRARRSDRSKRR